MAVQQTVSRNPRSLTWAAPPAEPAPVLDWQLLLYNLALLFAMPVLMAYALWRMERGKSRTGWGERFGFVPQAARYRPGGPRVWLHGVSVGEIAVASSVFKDLRQHVPTAQVVITTTTPTGRRMAQKSCPGADIFYFPFDLMPAVERALRLVRPDVCLLMESEMWPNFLAAARRRGISTVVVNGRISERTWRRLRKMGPLFRWVVRRVDRFCMQSEVDANRIIRLGADPARVTNFGNVKFDQIIPRLSAEDRAELARELGVDEAETVILAASTHPTEEQVCLQAFKAARQVDPRARLIIALRHIERASEAEQIVAEAGFHSRRRTQGRPPRADDPDTVVILDTIGELERVYAVATIAFVGGSFVTIGGHNVLQATAQGVPCVVGPNMHNFRDIANVVIQGGVGFQVQTAEALGRTFAWLLEDRRRLREIDERCDALLARYGGAAHRSVIAMTEMLGYRPPGAPGGLGSQLKAFAVGALSGIDRSAAARMAVVLLAPLSALHWLGLKVNRLMYALGLARVTRLPAPVVSIGNLTTGGTGKTSAAALLARSALRRGLHPAILSRGYGRRRGRAHAMVVSDGRHATADPALAGDEPLLLAGKVKGAAVVVGKDRRATGRHALDALGADLLILDDGFQYWRLAKSTEIVLIDALAPFGTGLLLPAGILREPLSHLRRADAIWLTHSDLVPDERRAAIRECLRKVFAGPIVETVHRPLALRSLNGGEPRDINSLEGALVAALSAIGNPLAFELTLERLGARVLPLRYPDHYPYGQRDCRAIQRFAQRRDAIIVTTEKDAVRLRAHEFSAPVWVLEVEMAAREAGTTDLTSALEVHTP
jgi:3-deoxy-D-manno-octulosonic-acid transferase